VWSPTLECVGPALCLLSAACFGGIAIFGKFAYAAGVPVDTLVLVRFTLAAALLAALWFGRALPRSGRRPASAVGPARRRALATALGLGAIGYAAQGTLYFAALERIDATLLTLVFYSYPLLVTVAAAVLGRDRLTPRRGLALAVASGGMLLVLLGAGGDVRFDLLGVALGFGTAAVYTVYILVADPVVHRLPPMLLTTLVMTGASGTLALRAAATGGVGLDFGLDGWFWLVCIAVVSTVVASLTFFAGMRRTGPSTAAILSIAEPIVTSGLAALTLGESLAPIQFLGGLLVLSAVVVLQTGRSGTRPVPAARAELAV